MKLSAQSQFGVFLNAVYKDHHLKNRLILWTFLGLVLPTAFLVAAGVPERVACVVMIVLMFPLWLVVHARTSRPSNIRTRTAAQPMWSEREKSQPYLKHPKSLKHPTMLKVLTVAAISGTVNWLVGMMFVLLLFPMLESFGALPSPLEWVLTTEHRMTSIVVVPFIFALVGFALGALMAFLYNMFVKTLLRYRYVEVVEGQRSEEAGFRKILFNIYWKSS